MSKYVINAFWMILEKVLKIIFTFLFLGMVARRVTVADFGVLNLAISIVTSLWVISSLGIDSILLKEFSLKKYKENDLLSTAFLARLCCSLIVILISVVFIELYNVDYHRNDYKVVFYIIISSLIFYNFNTLYTYHQAYSRAILNTKVSIISLVLSMTVKLYLYIYDFGLIYFAWSFFFDVFINLFLVIILNRSRNIEIRIRHFQKDVFLDLFKQGWPMFFASCLLVAYSRLDQFMIAYLLGVSHSGIYSIALRISDAYSFVPLIIATSFYPLIAKDPTDENIKNYFSIVFFSAFITGLVVIAVAPYVIPYMFGDAYLAAVSVLNITVFSTMFAVLGSACTNYMVLFNLGFYRLIRISAGLIVNIILNLMMIPKFGIIGAAWATLISQLFVSWLGNVFAQKTLHCFKLQTSAIIGLGIFGTISILKKKL